MNRLLADRAVLLFPGCPVDHPTHVVHVHLVYPLVQSHPAALLDPLVLVTLVDLVHQVDLVTRVDLSHLAGPVHPGLLVSHPLPVVLLVPVHPWHRLTPVDLQVQLVLTDPSVPEHHAHPVVQVIRDYPECLAAHYHQSALWILGHPPVLWGRVHPSGQDCLWVLLVPPVPAHLSNPDHLTALRCLDHQGILLDRVRRKDLFHLADPGYRHCRVCLLGPAHLVCPESLVHLAVQGHLVGLSVQPVL